MAVGIGQRPCPMCNDTREVGRLALGSQTKVPVLWPAPGLAVELVKMCRLRSN